MFVRTVSKRKRKSRIEIDDERKRMKGSKGERIEKWPLFQSINIYHNFILCIFLYFYLFGYTHHIAVKC